MISVIVPVYKVEPYLHQCVDSILHQTYRDIEVLLIDDGSPDKCGEICDEYERKDKRVRVFHTENRGLSTARNIGLWEAQGDYIGFIDSDDWIEPDMYNMLICKINETKADISICGFWEGFQELYTQPQIICDGEEAIIALIEQKISTCLWNKLYRRNVFDGILFPFGKNFEDTASMHIILSQAQKIVTVSVPMYHHRLRLGSITKVYSAKNLIDYADAYLARFYFITNEMSGLFSERKEDVLLFAAKGISRVWRWWYGCDPNKKQYEKRIKEFVDFSRQNFPLFGYKSWPLYLRLTMIFMYNQNKCSFAILYWLNQWYRKNQTKGIDC